MNQRQLVKGMLDALAATESDPLEVAVVEPRPTLIVPPPSKRAVKAARPKGERYGAGLESQLAHRRTWGKRAKRSGK